MIRDRIGRVTLVGAGPGDPDLLTVKAIKAMRAADIILFDALVSEEVLSFARRETKRMLIGKRGHRQSCRQDEINELMLKLARMGKHVVRLKGGDPVVFGRAGEEIDHLRREGIPVSIVPGITSASALAASLGISLTHRDHSQSVRFVTGHSKHGTVPVGLDWKGLAARDTTLVIYMGARTGAAFARRLIKEGLTPNTSCVVAEYVSRADEQLRLGKLSDLARGELLTKTDGPVLIGVGESFSRSKIAAESSLHCESVESHLINNHAALRIFEQCVAMATGIDNRAQHTLYSLPDRQTEIEDSLQIK